MPGSARKIDLLLVLVARGRRSGFPRRRPGRWVEPWLAGPLALPQGCPRCWRRIAPPRGSPAPRPSCAESGAQLIVIPAPALLDAVIRGAGFAPPRFRPLPGERRDTERRQRCGARPSHGAADRLAAAGMGRAAASVAAAPEWSGGTRPQGHRIQAWGQRSALGFLLPRPPRPPRPRRPRVLGFVAAVGSSLGSPSDPLPSPAGVPSSRSGPAPRRVQCPRSQVRACLERPWGCSRAGASSNRWLGGPALPAVRAGPHRLVLDRVGLHAQRDLAHHRDAAGLHQAAAEGVVVVRIEACAGPR